MSDLSMYELEDIILDDFDQCDDHIVPHLTNAWTSKNPFEGDSCKKPRCESTSVMSNFDASNTFCQVKSERDINLLDNTKIMMEKESSGVFNASCDVEIVKDTCDETRMSDKCFKNSYITSDALYNNCDNKGSGDLLYYGWPDIGNFEDVDNMLRSCDSSFGLDNDEWFTSNQIGGGGSEDTLKMDFKYPCSEPSGLNNILPEGNLMDSCGDISFEGTGSVVDDKKQGFQPLFVGSPRQMGMLFQTEKKTRISESQNDVGVGSLNVPESSSISSELDQISVEATSYRQLQQVMEQLDLRTKLCIRDSLYRLAKSAEQRHNNNPSATNINDIGGPLMAERSDTGLMDMETDTNPIDRSVAHLLFHRPSESPKMNAKHGSMKGEEEANEK